MKVLLLGDYSGLGSTLKEGLLQLGVDVVLASNGDGWKNIQGGDTFLFPNDGTNFISRKSNHMLFPRKDKRFCGYDVVQCPGTDIFSWSTGTKPFDNLMKNNNKFFINAAGVDCYLYDSWKNHKLKYDYYMFDDNPDLEKWLGGNNISSFMRNRRCRKIMKKADGIIPVIPYEYEISYEGFTNLRKAIVLPINVDKYKYLPNIVEKRIIFFHGINRIYDKGSDLIKKAMIRAQKMYPKDIECIIAERMPFDEYTQNIERANVIIDQCKSYGYGMNALISMAKGKVVFSGAEKEVISRISSEDCPVVNIRPDEEQIYAQIMSLIEKKTEILDMGLHSREYVFKYHNYIDVAKKYLETWCE